MVLKLKILSPEAEVAGTPKTFFSSSAKKMAKSPD